MTLAGILLTACQAHATVYSIGPGQTYAALGAAPWDHLAPGDRVRICWRSTPYHEKILVSCRGTADQPIKIVGVPGPDGRLPIIDGENATTSPQFEYPYAPTQDRGLIILSRNKGQKWGYKPGYLEIENLELRNACRPNTYKDGQGAERAYTVNAAALFVERGEHITVHGCTITNSGNGLFVASGGEEQSVSRDILVEYCSIFGNGTPNRDREHNVYTEADGIVFQYNYLGPPRTGSLGNNLKDRSVGTVIRYNWIERGGHCLDLVEPQESYPVIGKEPALHQTFVYGNVIFNGPNGATSMIHYGGDNGQLSTYRKGTLYFYHNTVVNQANQTGPGGRWRTILLALETDGETADVRDNIFYVAPATPGMPATEISLLSNTGVLHLGVNWISPHWLPYRSGVPTNGSMTGAERLLSDAANNPGFVDLAAHDLRLKPDSPCRSRAEASDAALPEGHRIVSQLRMIKPEVCRPTERRSARDLGALEEMAGRPRR